MDKIEQAHDSKSFVEPSSKGGFVDLKQLSSKVQYISTNTSYLNSDNVDSLLQVLWSSIKKPK